MIYDEILQLKNQKDKLEKTLNTSVIIIKEKDKKIIQEEINGIDREISKLQDEARRKIPKYGFVRVGIRMIGNEEDSSIIIGKGGKGFLLCRKIDNIYNIDGYMFFYQHNIPKLYNNEFDELYDLSEKEKSNIQFNKSHETIACILGLELILMIRRK